MTKHKQKSKGFTLIELLVVVLIIGILAAIALPQYKFAVAKTKYSTMMHLVRDIAYSQERYFLTHGSYAVNFEVLDIVMPQGYVKGEKGDYCYSWGACSVKWQESVACYDYKADATFFIYLKNATKYSANRIGKSSCVTNGFDNAFSKKLCQRITNTKKDIGAEYYNFYCEHAGTSGNEYFFGSY